MQGRWRKCRCCAIGNSSAWVGNSSSYVSRRDCPLADLHSRAWQHKALKAQTTPPLKNTQGAPSVRHCCLCCCAPLSTGWPHYYLNRGCDTAMLVATWPSGTKTTFALAALSAIPPSLLGDVFATTGTAPMPKPGFPIIKDPDCLRRCAANRSTAKAQGR